MACTLNTRRAVRVRPAVQRGCKGALSTKVWRALVRAKGGVQGGGVCLLLETTSSTKVL